MRSGRRLLLLAAAALVALAASVVVQKVFWTAGAGLFSTDPQVLAQGEKLYHTHCAACHGARLEGQPDWRSRGPDGRLPAPPHDASGHTWHHTAELLTDIVRDGMIPPWAPEGYQSDMPAFRGVLPDSDIHAVLAYIVSRWPPEVRERWLRMQEQVRAQRGR